MIIIDNYKVYAHINKINGKMYIGITKQKPERRWGSNGCGYKHNLYFCRAIEKYGWDNFEHEIIASGLTKEEAENFEILLIDKLKSNQPNFGYNISNGGETIGKHSEESKLKMSKAKKGKYTGADNHMYGKHLSPKARKILSEKTKARFKDKTNHPMYGRKMSEEYKKNISDRMKGKYTGKLNPNYGNGDKICGSKNPSARKVICVTTKKIFDTMTEASTYYPSANRRSIGSCCEKSQKTAGEFNGQKLQWMYYEEYLEFGNTCKDADIYDSGVQIICLNNHKIYFNSVKASEELKLNSTAIRECCNLSRTWVKDISGNKFYFMDYDDYLKYGEFDFKLKRNKNVYCKTNNTIYPSINNIHEKLNLSTRDITIVCNTKLYKNKTIDAINKDGVVFNFEYV